MRRAYVAKSAADRAEIIVDTDDVCQREHSYHFSLFGKDGHPADLLLAHFVQGVVEFLDGLTALDIARHDLAHRRVAPERDSSGANGDIPVGQHADYALALDHRQRADCPPSAPMAQI
nr:hypothetical protein [Sphingobium sp. TKS]